MVEPRASQWVGRWEGQAVVCIGSGPSLTAEDCEAVRDARLPAIVTNTTFRMCPWAEVLFGFDCKWWEHYRDEVSRTFKGERLAYSPAVRSLGIPSLHGHDWFRHFHNSGASSISLAIVGGAARVILLGFDCQRVDGKTHWHGDHPKSLSNARSIGNWPTQFKGIARFAAGEHVPVLNASRATALTCFPRVSLAEVLAEEVAA